MDLIKLKEIALSENIPIIEDEGLEFLSGFIKEHTITKVLEIGSGIGYSAIGLALKNQNLKITTIEKDSLRYQKAQNHIELFQLGLRIKLINGDALKVKLDEVFQLIFVDAAKSQTSRFINHFYDSLKAGGYLIVDNLNFHGFTKQYPNISNRNTRQLVGKIIRFKKEIVLDSRFEVLIKEDLGDGLAILKKL